MPEDPYGIAKYAVEMDLKCAHDLFGMNYVVFRPHNVYGENQNIGDRYRNVVGIFMNQLMKGEPLSIYGDGIQTRAFSYIDDVAPIIAMAVETNSAQNQIFNIGGVENTSVKDLAQTVMKSMRLNGEIKHFAARNETEHAFSDHSKLERIFGTLSKTPLEKGLKNMAEWAKSAGSKPSKKFKNIEILDGLPANWSE